MAWGRVNAVHQQLWIRKGGASTPTLPLRGRGLLREPARPMGGCAAGFPERGSAVLAVFPRLLRAGIEGVDAGRHLHNPSSHSRCVYFMDVVPGFFQGFAGLVQFVIGCSGDVLNVNPGRTGNGHRQCSGEQESCNFAHSASASIVLDAGICGDALTLTFSRRERGFVGHPPDGDGPISGWVLPRWRSG